MSIEIQTEAMKLRVIAKDLLYKAIHSPIKTQLTKEIEIDNIIDAVVSCAVLETINVLKKEI